MPPMNWTAGVAEDPIARFSRCLVCLLPLLPLFHFTLVVAWVGLWLLKHWVRTLYTAVLTLFLGPVIMSVLSAMFYSISSIAAWIILGLVWLSESRVSFEVRAWHRAQPDDLPALLGVSLQPRPSAAG